MMPAVAIALAIVALVAGDNGDAVRRRISYWIIRGLLGAWLLRAAFELAFGYMDMIPVVAMLTAMLFPWLIATRVFVPLGMWRSAFALGALSRLAWEGTEGGSVVAGAWALARSGRASPNAVAFLQRRRDARNSTSAGHIVATALLLSARGDRDGAREVFESLALLGSRVPPLPRKLAGEWLCADAAARGAWKRAARIARETSARSRITRFISAAAARMVHDETAPGSAVLWLLWILAPRRRRTRSLLLAALAASEAPIAERKQAESESETPPGTDERPDTLALALDLHIRTVASRVTVGSLATLGRAWDRALNDPNTRDGTYHRAAVLGAPSGTRALAELEIEIRSELAQLVRQSQICLADLPDDSPMLSAAANQVREDLLKDLEVAFDALARRVDSHRPLPGAAEWREFVSLRSIYLRAAKLGGMSLRRVAFPDVHHRICALAVWLWNDRKEYIISQGMFLWLLEEAIAVGDQEAIELQKKNTATTY